MSRVRNKGGVDRLCTVEGITCYDSMSRVKNKEVNQRQVKLISGIVIRIRTRYTELRHEEGQGRETVY